MNTKQKLAAAAMIPLVSGQALFEEKAESLKADLRSVLLDLEGPVNLVDGVVQKHRDLGLIKD